MGTHLHCYPNTEPWIKSQGPYVEALGKYWNRSWTAKSEAEVIEEFKRAGVEAVLVAFDIETVTGTPPCSNDYVAKVHGDNPGVILQAWAAVDPFKGEAAIEEAKRAIRKLSMLGFHFHPIMGHFSVDDRRFYPLWETINELQVPVMIDVGTTGMGAGMPGGLGAIIRHAHPAASGILVVAIDVRWAKEAPYPASVADANYGIRWLKLKAREWKGGPETVGALGSSSGGHVIELCAMRPRDARYTAHPLPEAPRLDATLTYTVVRSPISDPFARYSRYSAPSIGS